MDPCASGDPPQDAMRSLSKFVFLSLGLESTIAIIVEAMLVIVTPSVSSKEITLGVMGDSSETALGGGHFRNGLGGTEPKAPSLWGQYRNHRDEQPLHP